MSKPLKEIKIKFKNGNSIKVNMKGECDTNPDLLSGEITMITGYDHLGNVVNVTFNNNDVLYIVEIV